MKSLDMVVMILLALAALAGIVAWQAAKVRAAAERWLSDVQSAAAALHIEAEKAGVQVSGAVRRSETDMRIAWIWLETHIETLRGACATTSLAFTVIAAAAWYIGR